MKALRLRIVVWAFFIMFVCSSVSAMEQTTNLSHIKVGAQNFWSSYLSAFSDADKLKIKTWQANRLDIATGGANLLPYNSNTLSGGYLDHVFIYPNKLNQVEAVAAAHGYVFEDMLWHMSVNYQVDAGWLWKIMDKFDYGESDANGVLTKGVFLLNGKMYTDKTTAAYDTTVADVIIADKLFVGCRDPFADINFILATVAVGKTVSIDYWNGSSWATLTVTDGTNGLTQNGLITFTPPANWSKTVVNGSRSKWWVRFTVTGSGTNPVASRIYGDNWKATDGTNNCRGWDATSGTIVGTGELAYNPTPPATATAKFKHQARVTGMWSPNATFGNHSNIQGGERTWATYMADQAKSNLAISNGNAFMFDDGNTDPVIRAPSDALTSHSDFIPASTRREERTASYVYTRNLIKSSYPTVKVGTLSKTQSFVYNGDWNMNESFGDCVNIKSSVTYNAGDPTGLYSTSFDGYLPANNPNSVTGIMMFMDSFAYGKTDQSGTWFAWDRGNRGPMIALAAYYIGANENTYFAYNVSGTNYQYYGSPGTFHYYSPAATTLTQVLTATSTAATQDIYGADFSAFPAAAMLRVGADIFYTYSKISNTQLRTFPSKVYNTYAPGTKIQFVVEKNMALDAIPADVEMESWGMWFPAIAANVGTPIEFRNITWKLWPDIGGSSASSGNVWKRDYTNARILVRPSNYNMTSAQVNTPSSPIDLGGTYYPLMANGSTGAPITSIQLRTGEGAILMKAPLQPGDLIPSAPPVPKTPAATKGLKIAY